MLLRKTLPFLLLILISPLLSFAQTALIKGKIVDENNQPVQGASVKLEDTQFNTITDSSGGFEFKDVPVAEYILTVTSGGFFTMSTRVDANGPEVNLKDLIISHEIAAGPADEIPTAVLTE